MKAIGEYLHSNRYPRPRPENTPTNGQLVGTLCLVCLAITFLVSCAKTQGWL